MKYKQKAKEWLRQDFKIEPTGEEFARVYEFAQFLDSQEKPGEEPDYLHKGLTISPIRLEKSTKIQELNLDVKLSNNRPNSLLGVKQRLWATENKINEIIKKLEEVNLKLL